MADQYDTKLDEKQEAGYQKWRSTLPKPLQYEGDYDLRGAYLDNAGTSKGSDGKPHMTDRHKKPNHPKFSSESKYAGPDAPRWKGKKLVRKDGSVVADESEPVTGLKDIP